MYVYLCVCVWNRVATMRMCPQLMLLESPFPESNNVIKSVVKCQMWNLLTFTLQSTGFNLVAGMKENNNLFCCQTFMAKCITRVDLKFRHLLSIMSINKHGNDVCLSDWLLNISHIKAINLHKRTQSIAFHHAHFVFIYSHWFFMALLRFKVM